MAKQGYPTSLNCWLKGYPTNIRVVFGPSISDLGGPWSNGSILDLIRIGIDTPDTNPVQGQVPPDIKVTYSDNGSDSNWIFKIGMYGWGTFFSTDDENYYILLEKFLEFESTYFDKIMFRYREVRETRIPKTTSIPNVEIPEQIIYEDPVGPSLPNNLPSLDDLNHAYLANNLIQSYWWIWNIDHVNTVSVTKSRTSNLDISGWRQLEGSTFYGPYRVDFWINGGLLKVTFGQTSVNCEDLILGDGDPVNCEYSFDITDAFYWNTLTINGYNRLPDLLRRA